MLNLTSRRVSSSTMSFASRTGPDGRVWSRPGCPRPGHPPGYARSISRPVMVLNVPFVPPQHRAFSRADLTGIGGGRGNERIVIREFWASLAAVGDRLLDGAGGAYPEDSDGIGGSHNVLDALADATTTSTASGLRADLSALLATLGVDYHPGFGQKTCQAPVRVSFSVAETHTRTGAWQRYCWRCCLFVVDGCRASGGRSSPGHLEFWDFIRIGTAPELR